VKIELRNLIVKKQGRILLDNISASITNSCAILGESGSGKSTLAMAILGMTPYTGAILHNGLTFALVPQDPATALHPLKKISTLLNEVYPQAKQKELLQNVGFSDPEQILKSYPHQLSGGMKQRVLIALALGSNPDVLIADEPTTGLDKSVQDQIVAFLAQLKIPLLLITHDESIANTLCSEKLHLEAGKLVHYEATHA